MNLFPARLLIAAFLLSAMSGAASGQSVGNGCGAPPAILSPTQPNIFSDQQEQWLGEAIADQIERNYRPVQDPAENEYLGRIAKRLLAALPPTKIQFRLALIDSASINGFSTAGGRVYLTRKLVAGAKSEDEVAAVIAHEMGHILTHQIAIQTTGDLKRLLNVTSVGDRADVYEKFQMLSAARMTDKHPSKSGNSDEGQDVADTISVYAMAAAGYRKQAESEFWDRMFFVEGKVGNPLSDFFGITRPESKRLRSILKLVDALPPGCGDSEPHTSPEFEHWHDLVVANQPKTVDTHVKAVAEVALTPPLRMSLDRLRFSRDGRYVLAQDESSIFVLSRDRFAQLFRFDAERALPAEFSPDSQRIVFHTPGLHTEEWSIADQKLLTAHEPIARKQCMQTKLSPDGRTLFCISTGQQGVMLALDLSLLDPATGDVYFQKKSFFVPTFAFYTKMVLSQRLSLATDLVPSSLSEDGNVLLIGPGEDKLAFDLRTRQPISIGGGLKGTISGPYAFLGNDKIVGVATGSVKDSGVFSFPDGRRLQAVPFGLTDLESVTDGNYVLSRNIEDFAVGLADVSAAKFVAASKAASMDVWNGWVVNENADGSILLRKLSDAAAPHQTVTLPISPLGPALLAVMSDDGRFLALSTRTRGGVWDLTDGERVLLAQHFDSAGFALDDSVYLSFPKVGKQERGIVHFAFVPFSATPVGYKAEDTMRLTHGVLQEWKRTDKGDKKAFDLIVHDERDDSVLWQRTFAEGEPAHTPNIVAGETVFAFLLKSDFAKDRMEANPALAAQAALVKNREKAGIIQVLDDRTGNIVHESVVEIPLDYGGLQGVHVVGDLLYLTGLENRTIVYSAASGAQIRQMFGQLIAADDASGRVCAVNRSDEAVVYDAKGQQLADFRMGSALRFATFRSSGDGPAGRLILLTADQKVRTMEVPAAPAQSGAAQ